ncbi:unnamed protein product [Schistosoma mattheei]|uniref:Aldehyde dehydrogenase domain-containing protein n=1 Tax=Schistosoma mattheei TaxID=31246 RepID=A0A3P8KS65_9TREM|nr:unnamed protein product [Schistosoma mattheei]
MSRLFQVTNEPVLLHKPGSTERQKLDSTLNTMIINGPYHVPICIDSNELSSGHPRRQILHSKTLVNFYHASGEQIKYAIESCLIARKTWSRTSFDERAKIFLKAADLVSDKYRMELLASTILGQAKTIFQAEIDAAAELADFLRFNVKFASGFWAAIPPFNFTAIAGNLASAPALMGNVVIWKPADTSIYSNYLVYR